MSQQRPDNWKKPRSHGKHLTTAEIERIRVAYRTGRRPEAIARELQCASRTVHRYYSQFRGASKIADRPSVHVDEPKTPSKPVDRFYRGNFEL